MERVENRPIDLEYATLSFVVGWFACAADQYLGRDHFIPLGREHRWHLTVELLQGWRQEARDLGVPEEIAEAAPPDVVLAAALPVGFWLQDEADQRRDEQHG